MKKRVQDIGIIVVAKRVHNELILLIYRAANITGEINSGNKNINVQKKFF